MTKEQLAAWIVEAEANVANHERNIVAAFDRRDFATADRLIEWRDRLVKAIERNTAKLAA
jgi:hypothetical protein